MTLVAAMAAALGLAAAAAFLVPALQEPAPRKTLQPQESLDSHGAQRVCCSLHANCFGQE